MGFFKFLKKKGSQQEDMLDLPPMPPPTEHGEDLGLSPIGDDIPPPPLEDFGGEEFDLPQSHGENIIPESLPMDEVPPQINIRQQQSVPITTGNDLRFIGVESYKRIIDELGLSKTDADVAEEKLSMANKYTEAEARMNLRLKAEFEDMQKKFIVIDKLLSS